MKNKNFTDDIQTLRDIARKNIDKGVITENYTADVDSIVELLNVALASEIICVLRYKNHYYKSKELGSKIAADEFLEHAQQEQAHADMLADRLAQLGKVPKMSLEFIKDHSHSEYIECETVGEMIKENLIAERIAVDTYRQMLQYIKDSDPTTRKILEEILAVEEEHADDLIELKAAYNIDF